MRRRRRQASLLRWTHYASVLVLAACQATPSVSVPAPLVANH